MRILNIIFIWIAIILSCNLCLGQKDKEVFSLEEPRKLPEVSVSQPYPEKPTLINSNMVLAEPVIASPVEIEE
ncbi:MAG: hypothetical protein NC900_01030 [Candidatus Omnitrophica bacterium]|nr:hypothetical protein [Candidatus Omnitrophota bacterium]